MMPILLTTLVALLFVGSQPVASQLFIRDVVYRTEGTTGAGPNNTVVLGGIFPVHNSGPNRDQPCGGVISEAVQLVESMVLAIQMINEDPTLLPGITLAFDIRDTCFSINYALEQSVDYIQSCSQELGLGVSAVVGAARSTVSEAAANLFGLFEIPQVSYASTATFFSEDRFSFFFRTISSDNFQVRALVDIIVEFGWEYVVLLHSNDLYGNGGSEAIVNEIDQRNSTNCIAIRIALIDDDNGNNNYADAVNQMQQEWVRNASVVLLFGHVTNAVGMLKEIKGRVGENPDFPLQNLTWIGSDSWGDSLPDNFRSLAKGMLSTVPRSESIDEFDAYFTSLNPANNIANPWFIEYWESEFECNLGLSPELENCTVDSQFISANTTNYSQVSVVALVFDAVFALAHSIQNLITDKCPDGGLCSDIITNGIVNGILLREELLNVSFPGKSQNTMLSFDSNGDVGGSYSVLNLQKLPNDQFEFVGVGSWNAMSALSINKEDIEWVTGAQPPQTTCSLPCGVGEIMLEVPRQASCCFTCRPCLNNTAAINNSCVACDATPGLQANENHTDCISIPISFLTWSNPWAVLLTLLASIGVVTTSAVIVIFLVFYKHELIKASSRELSAILLIGLFLCYLMPFFYIAEPSAAICAIRRFGVGFCFAISYSALLVKTNRIYRIFSRNQNSSAKPLQFISPLSQVLFTLAFISVQIVIGIVWLAVQVPATEVVPSSTTNELTCASSPVINLIVSLGYNLFLLILCTYFAFLTRKVPANFNEAKFINATMYSTCLIWLAFVPTFFATNELGTIFQTTSLALGVIFSATIALSCLFITKVVFLLSQIKEQHNTEGSLHSHSVHAFSSIPNTTVVPKGSTLENSIYKTPDVIDGKL